MGTNRWSDDHYVARATHRAATSTPTFAYTDDVVKGKTKAEVHEKLDPKSKIRESCDSDTNPNSRAVAVMLDVTGSMADVPIIMQKSLPKLMGLLLQKSYLECPHILVGAIGDASVINGTQCDKAPLQVGQFESGIEIENDLTNLYLERGGGGQQTESYELAMYFLARHTKMDCFTKRNQKGYLFIIGDEQPYNSVNKDEVKKIIGDDLQANIPVEEILAELQEKFEVFFVLPNLTSYYNDAKINKRWNELLGQKVLKLDDPAGITELIATTIGVYEGKIDHTDIESDLTDIGTPTLIAGSVSRALAVTSGGKISKKKATGTDIAVAESGAGSGIATL